jgi:rhodanese-related sulfurtransferase
LIPVGQIPQRLNEFDKEHTYLMVCRSGRRSENATTILNSNGYKAINMEGGMIAWSN